ncbi:MAG: helix-hairpin-helix domain-containing protein [Candidatus Zixiibacteriota bacterium]|nr:MAG: helix-hairpin-helix domain-containing protein [candidate division Zixibacteria bacterium]
MSFFKPAEIRAILILSALVFIGSALTLLKRQGRLSDLELDTFLSDNRYNYSYNVADFAEEKRKTDDEPAKADLAETANDSSENRVIDINSAGYFDLQTLPGIGPVLAERIMAHRDSVGAFRSTDELLNVQGIGEKKYARIKNRIALK